MRLDRISHPDWVKLCVELSYAPNQNSFCYKFIPRTRIETTAGLTTSPHSYNALELPELSDSNHTKNEFPSIRFLNPPKKRKNTFPIWTTNSTPYNLFLSVILFLATVRFLSVILFLATVRFLSVILFLATVRFLSVILFLATVRLIINHYLLEYLGGVMVKAMHCGIVVREFVLQSRYYVHFRANTLGKGMNPLILPPAMGK